ncbi:MAG: bifunctional DNA primase/polymerase, partial [Gammaproteobacteria bacterium]|nr:bifunctional DNA primase/polymerase [Gammaproteobacteria bacterium]
MLEVALAHVRYGFPIVALRPRDKAPAVSGWQGIELGEADVRAYWGAHPAANVGLRCGATGFVALDLDGDEWVAWALDHLPATPLRTVSGSGHGGHLIYRWPVGVPIAKRRLSVAGLPDSRIDKGHVHKGGDLYGDGVQVVLPGSVHPSGGVYRWAHEGPLPALDTVPFFDLAWLDGLSPAAPAVPAATRPAPSTSSSTSSQVKRASAWMAKRDGAIQGCGGDLHTFVTACELVHGFGLSDGEALAQLVAWNARCVPPWSEADLRVKVRSARTSGQGGAKPDRGGETTDREALRTGAASWRAEVQASTSSHDDDRSFFDDEPAPAPTPTKQRRAPADGGARLSFPVKAKGKPVADHSLNTAALLKHYGVTVGYNLMRHTLEIECPTFRPNAERAANATLSWVENRAADHGLGRRCVYPHLVELAREVHPVLDWVQAAPWDGVDRIEALIDTLHL